MATIDVSDELAATFEVEPPLRAARRRDFQALDADVQPGGMIVAGVHYRREEVDAARRLLRELGQPERALRSVLEFVRRESVGTATVAYQGKEQVRASSALHAIADRSKSTSRIYTRTRCKRSPRGIVISAVMFTTAIIPVETDRYVKRLRTRMRGSMSTRPGPTGGGAVDDNSFGQGTDNG